MAEDAALIDVEDTGVGGMGGRVLDPLAQAALGAQAVERQFPGDVGLEVSGGAAGAEDEVFVGGAFGDEGADFFLSRRQGGVSRRLVEREVLR